MTDSANTTVAPAGLSNALAELMPSEAEQRLLDLIRTDRQIALQISKGRDGAWTVAITDPSVTLDTLKPDRTHGVHLARRKSGEWLLTQKGPRRHVRCSLEAGSLRCKADLTVPSPSPRPLCGRS